MLPREGAVGLLGWLLRLESHMDERLQRDQPSVACSQIVTPNLRRGGRPALWRPVAATSSNRYPQRLPSRRTLIVQPGLYGVRAVGRTSVASSARGESAHSGGSLKGLSLRRRRQCTMRFPIAQSRRRPRTVSLPVFPRGQRSRNPASAAKQFRSRAFLQWCSRRVSRIRTG